MLRYFKILSDVKHSYNKRTNQARKYDFDLSVPIRHFLHSILKLLFLHILNDLQLKLTCSTLPYNSATSTYLSLVRSLMHVNTVLFNSVLQYMLIHKAAWMQVRLPQ